MILADDTAVAAIGSLIVFLLVVAIALAVQVWIIRAGLDPVREQLQRIADEIEVRNDFDAGEQDESG